MIMSGHRTAIAICLLVTLLAAPAGAAAQQAAQLDQQTQPPATPAGTGNEAGRHGCSFDRAGRARESRTDVDYRGARGLRTRHR